MHDLTVIQKFVELRAKNITLEKIASELNVSARTLINWNKKYFKDILFRKQMEIDLLKEKFNISDSQNLEFYAQVIDKCKQAFLTDNYKSMLRIDLVRIFKMAMNKVIKCDIINASNVNKFLKTQEELIDSETDDKYSP